MQRWVFDWAWYAICVRFILYINKPNAKQHRSLTNIYYIHNLTDQRNYGLYTCFTWWKFHVFRWVNRAHNFGLILPQTKQKMYLMRLTSVWIMSLYVFEYVWCQKTTMLDCYFSMCAAWTQCVRFFLYLRFFLACGCSVFLKAIYTATYSDDIIRYCGIIHCWFDFVFYNNNYSSTSFIIDNKGGRNLALFTIYMRSFLSWRTNYILCV